MWRGHPVRVLLDQEVAVVMVPVLCHRFFFIIRIIELDFPNRAPARPLQYHSMVSYKYVDIRTHRSKRKDAVHRNHLMQQAGDDDDKNETTVSPCQRLGIDVVTAVGNIDSFCHTSTSSEAVETTHTM